jgi:hypothetical protein
MTMNVRYLIHGALCWATALMVLAVLAVRMRAQDLPHPYVGAGLSLMPDGYTSAAYRVQGGLYWIDSRFTSDCYGAYDNGHKDDGSGPGRDRYLNGSVAYQHDSFFYAAGARWSELSTREYVKPDFRIQFGVGHDWLGWFSMRGQVLYVLPPLHESVDYPGEDVCSGCGNGVQGPEFTLIFPSPADKSPRAQFPGWRSHHLFIRFVIGIYEYHDTITEPSNELLSATQDHNRHAMGTTSFMLMYRF